MISADDQRALEALHSRYVHATDRHDHVLLRSLYTDDAVEHHGDYNGPIDGFIVWLKQAQGYFEIATHVVTNLLFAVDGDTAESEGRGTAYLRLRGDPASNMIVVNRLFDRYRKVDGQWLFSRRSISADWVQTFPVGEGGLDMVKSVPAGKVGLDDPVYADVPTVIATLRSGLPTLG